MAPPLVPISGYLEDDYLSGPYLTGFYAWSTGMQAEMVTGGAKIIGEQGAFTITGTPVVTGMEAKFFKLRHAIQENYLLDPYMTDSYLAQYMGAFQGMQAQQLHATRMGMQAVMVLYNITQLRIMSEFPSRGTVGMAGASWTADSTSSGDFGANNLNTDIVEQVFRSGIGTASSVILTCDTGVVQGVSIDTLAILGHNLSKSATVQLQGLTSLIASPSVTIDLTVEPNNMYYIAPTFPPANAKVRYWRFNISDPANPDGFVQIGTIVFGTSEIFSLSESFLNPITRGFQHFKDEVKTEGFTNVMNNRALKQYMKIGFRDLRYFESNYQKLETYLKFARTSLKCLVIPTPEFPSRFAIFAKLKSLPDIVHESIGKDEEYIDLSLEWDESL